MAGISLKFTDEDHDIIDAIENTGTGNKTQRVKALLRLGITVEKINTLQLLFNKLSENGLIQPVEFAVASELAGSKKSLEDQEADEFLRNMIGSFSPLDPPEE